MPRHSPRFGQTAALLLLCGLMYALFAKGVAGEPRPSALLPPVVTSDVDQPLKVDTTATAVAPTRRERYGTSLPKPLVSVDNVGRVPGAWVRAQLLRIALPPPPVST